MRKTLLALIAIMLFVTTAGANVGTDFINKVDSSNLSSEQILLYKFYYIFEQQQLPAEYQPTEFSPLKCGTDIVRQFLDTKNELSARTVNLIEGYLTPEPTRATYVSPGGNFRMNYDTTGGNAVPSTDNNPPNGIPDYVEKCAEYMDHSWDLEVDQLGFGEPLIAPYYQVYFESMGSYGYTSVLNFGYTKITLHNTFQGFPPNDDPEGNVWGAAKVTAAHEFKHATQYVQSQWSEGGWVELDATWMEDIAYDVVNDYYNYLGSSDPITQPQISLDDGGTGSYEDCVFQHWMSQTWGNDIITDFWTYRETHTSQGMVASYNAILQQYGSSWDDGFPMFAAWNFAVHNRTVNGFGYDEADDYPTNPVTTIYGVPITTSGTINHLAAKMLYLNTALNGETGSLDITFDGQNAREMGLVAIVEKTDNTAHIEQIFLDGNNDASVSLSVPVEEISFVGIAISNSGAFSTATWDLTIETGDDPAVPIFAVTPSTVDQTMQSDETESIIVAVGNIGDEGSVLEWNASVASDPLLASRIAEMPVANTANADKDSANRSTELRGPLAAPAVRYEGDCQFGNTDFDNIQGSYNEWWWGNETYSYAITPSDYSCSCDGFNVRGLHMLLYLEPGSSPLVRAILQEADGAGCPVPGAVLATSDAITFSDVPEIAYYDVEIPCDFECADMDATYFLTFEFMDDAGPVGIVVDDTPQACVNYNDWGEGQVDLVADQSFVGDIYIWADVDCCGSSTPEVSVTSPNGGEAWAIGDSYDITWLATEMTDVEIELSRNNGSNWSTITSSTTNDGSYNWAVTGPVSNDCLVRVSDLTGTYTDVSDGTFSIYQPVDWLTLSPESGSVDAGSSQNLSLDFDTTGLDIDDYNAWVIITHNGSSSPDAVTVNLTVYDPQSGVGDTPLVFGMNGNYPNPFNPSTEVKFTLTQAGNVTVDVIDLQGRVVRTLFKGDLQSGITSLSWDGRDDNGFAVASGTYMARVVSGNGTATHKMTLAK